MIDLLPLLIATLSGTAVGGAGMYWLSRRPATTKALALKALHAELALIDKLPGAAESQVLATLEAQAESLAKQQIATLVAKLNAPQS